MRIRIPTKEKGKEGVSQAVEKVRSENLAHPDAICLTLGKIWCPIKGVGCTELRENVFLFTFRQVSSWRRALEDGPWWFDKELLVMEEFDPDKTVEEYDFNLIPMWLRVLGRDVNGSDRIG